MEQIIFLGTAASIATKKRDNTSLLISSAKDKILIDVPGALVNKLKRISVDHKSISKIFITHSHPDHLYGITAFLHSHYRLNNTIHIFSSQKVIKMLRMLRKTFALENIEKYPKVIYHPVKSKKFYESAEIKASAFKVKHSSESLGFKFFFKKSGIACVFSGDTAYTTELIKQSKNADYLIHDCFAPEKIFKKYPVLYKMHTSGLQLGKIARRAKVKVLLPIHFSGEVKYSMGEIKKEIKKNFSGRIIIPNDLESLQLRPIG